MFSFSRLGGSSGRSLGLMIFAAYPELSFAFQVFERNIVTCWARWNLLAFSCKGRWFCPSCHQKNVQLFGGCGGGELVDC